MNKSIKLIKLQPDQSVKKEKKGGKIQINNNRKESDDITTDLIDAKRSIMEYYKLLYAIKFNYSEEMNRLLEKHRPPKFT